MGCLGPRRLGLRPASRWRVRLLLLLKPALQGAFAGQRRRRIGGGQADADIASPPGGMLLAQRQGQFVDRLLVAGPSGTRSVGRAELVGLETETAQQATHRANGQVQRVGNSGRCLALLGSAKDELAER
jgi:hypothetical protein